ncbi:adenylate/guanylate cyclase domain-containing protein [Tundrisphaera lichenicola]|uniref:adenylate/guanylate cyclase domain-containing protein n=1 Tax=Tundrisphaera lichenicola TaxID=2029860 RepID=UPI003EBF6A90
MADLIAQGNEPQHRWRRPLVSGEWLLLGRGVGSLSVPWDKKVSRQHAEVRLVEKVLEVRRLPSARNAITVRGLESNLFSLRPGEHFVIGETTFTLADESYELAPEPPAPIEQRSYAYQEIQSARYRDADHRIDVLSRLPNLISGADDDQELFVRLVNMLLAGIPRADGIALVSVEHESSDRPSVEVLHWDRRRPNQAGGFRPSSQLILESMKRKQSVSCIWNGAGDLEQSPDFTMTGGVDWAYCTPVVGEMAGGWGIYAFGRFDFRVGEWAHPSSESPDLLADLKFTELVASILAALRQVRRLQRKQAVFSQFFSPVVIDRLADDDPEIVLAPRQVEVSVLFCDLRGFSRESERNSHDLLGLLERVSKALRVMTYQIMGHGGVIGDFQGDAAMGFWGWPIDQGDSAKRACLAALEIRTQFEANAARKGHPLANFRMGIGIASGVAVAGKIGTIDQVKVSVFGPVVNLASRLEGMTKFLHAPILIDETTARLARQQVSPDQGRFRRLAVIKPYGLETPHEVTELLPPLNDRPELTDEHIRSYESALDSLQRGQWSESLSYLSRVPPEDQVKDFLTVFIAQHGRIPPEGWDGVIPLHQKN